MSDRKFTEIEATVKIKYLIPDYIIAQYEDGLDGVIKEWFTSHDINRHHASRESSELAYGKTLISVEKVSDHGS